MLNSGVQQHCEHPYDVLSFLVAQVEAGTACTLAMLTATKGGAVRAPGAVMAVTRSGQSCGYLSGGCIDADVRLQAQAALKSGQSKTLRYGKGSPFLDMTLPCGGAIDVTLMPAPDIARIKDTIVHLKKRVAASLSLPEMPGGFTAHYRPKLALRIAGRSADPIALARLSIAAGIQTSLWSADPACLAAGKTIVGLDIVKLTSPSALPETRDDTATAFVLMMHDPDWEPALLSQALVGSAFYIGAVGSPHTHAKRCVRLGNTGLNSAQMSRIRAPIGLVPSMRDASMLAISTLAEIIQAFHNVPQTRPVTHEAMANV